MIGTCPPLWSPGLNGQCYENYVTYEWSIFRVVTLGCWMLPAGKNSSSIKSSPMIGEDIDSASSDEAIGSEEGDINFWNYCHGDDAGCAVCNCCGSKISTKFKGSHSKLSRVLHHFNVDKDGNTLPGPKSKKRKICKMNPFVFQTPSKRQSSLTTTFTPTVTACVQREFNIKFARWFFLTGTSFNKVHHQALQETFDCIRPGIKVPSRRFLAGSLLEDEYDYWKLKMVGPPKTTFLLLIIWQLVVVRHYLLMESLTERGKLRFTGMIQRIGPAKVCGVVTDNASANKLAWKILQRQYPSMYFYGCMSHTLHLFVKDLFKIEEFSELEEKAKEIVKFFKFHQVEAHLLAEIREDQDLKTLKLPGATRWGSLYRCFESLLNNRKALIAIVNTADFIYGTKKVRDQRTKIKKLVNNREVFLTFERIQAILKPLTLWLDHFQSDDSMISDAFYVFLDLKQQYLELVENCTISKEVYDDYLWPNLYNRWNAGYADIHGLSYLLDPVYQGEGMDEDNIARTLEVLKDLQLLEEHAFYKIKCNSSSCYIKMIKDKRLTTRGWILGLSPHETKNFPTMMS
eukprot:gene8852-9589_t